MSRIGLFVAAAFLLSSPVAAADNECPPAPGGYQLSGDGALRLADSATIPPDDDNRDWVCYQAWLAEGNTPEAEPAATIAQQYADKIKAGLQFTWTSAPTLNGTYSLSETAQQNISAIYSGIKGDDGLPGGGSTFVYLDAAGQGHEFTADQFATLAKVARDYLYALQVASRQSSPAWPSASKTIP